MIPVINYL